MAAPQREWESLPDEGQQGDRGCPWVTVDSTSSPGRGKSRRKTQEPHSLWGTDHMGQGEGRTNHSAVVPANGCLWAKPKNGGLVPLALKKPLQW